jgi:transglutaminase-like putative cysteine protease
MRPERWFRLLNHATLGLSCLCLVSAEVLFLPGVEVLLAPVVVLLVAAWWGEGRWVLPVWGANLLGMLILAGGAAWMGWLLLDPESWIQTAPLPAGLVPPLGPVLMALLLVKLFRPRGPTDFWLLQGMGLLQVGLTCVLGTGPEVGGLLAAYLAAGLGCLAAHYLAAARAAPGQPWAVAGTGGRMARGFLPGFVLRWTALVGMLALALFLLTPRIEDTDWQPLSRFGGTGAQRWGTGFHKDIDLLETGSVELSNEVTWTVQAADATGRPKTDLPADQRWRGMVVDCYDLGIWTAEPQLPRPLPGKQPQTELPDFGPGQVVLTFTVTPRQAGGLFLAEPIRLGPPERHLPALHLQPQERRRPLFTEQAGTVQASRWYAQRQEYVYRQVLPPPGDTGRTPAAHLSRAYIERLTHQTVAGLEEWTIRLLRRLAQEARYHLEGALPAPPADGSTRGFVLDPEQWERVARALADYLAHGGEYAYALELRRQDTRLDPVLDFLFNVKQGHCERFAAALALMLRSVGIPARIVKGFCGAEHQGEGIYLVRQSSAHSWVEALMPGQGEDGFDWLTLDPTPAAVGEVSSSTLARWWNAGRRSGLEFWRALIVDFNSDEQADLLAWLTARGGSAMSQRGGTKAVGGLLAVLVAGILLWRYRRKAGWLLAGLHRRGTRRSSLPVPFYRRLLALLERRLDLAPAPGQTPREFGTAAGEALRRRPATSGLADLPGVLIETMYRVRFGGEVLTEEEGRALEGRLDELALALRLI